MKRFAITSALAVTLLLCTSMWAQQSYSFQNSSTTLTTRSPSYLGINNGLRIAGYHNFNQNSGFTLKLPCGLRHRELSATR